MIVIHAIAEVLYVGDRTQAEMQSRQRDRKEEPRRTVLSLPAR